MVILCNRKDYKVFIFFIYSWENLLTLLLRYRWNDLIPPDGSCDCESGKAMEYKTWSDMIARLPVE